MRLLLQLQHCKRSKFCKSTTYKSRAGYTVAPTVTIVSATSTTLGVGSTTHGVGTAGTALLVTDSGIGTVTITSADGYPTAPTLFFGTPTSGVGTATGRVLVSAENTVTQVLISDAGIDIQVELELQQSLLHQ